MAGCQILKVIKTQYVAVTVAAAAQKAWGLMLLRAVQEFLENFITGIINELGSLSDMFTAIVDMAYAIINSVSLNQWRAYIAHHQMNIYKTAIASEITYMKAIITAITKMLRICEDDDKKYENLSALLHDVLRRTTETLCDAYNSNDILEIKDLYDRALRYMQAAKTLLGGSSGDNASVGLLKSALGDIKDRYQKKKGDPIKPVDYAAIGEAIINDSKNDLLGMLDFIKDWISILGLFTEAAEKYSGAEISMIKDEMVKVLSKAHSTARGTSVYDKAAWRWDAMFPAGTIDTSYRKIIKGDYAQKAFKDLSKGIIMPDTTGGSAMGCRTMSDGALEIINLCVARGSGSTTADNAYKEDIGAHIDDAFLKKIRNNVDKGKPAPEFSTEPRTYTARGNNTDGNLLVSNRSDKITSLLAATTLYAKMNELQSVQIEDAYSKQLSVDYVGSLETDVLNKLSKLMKDNTTLYGSNNGDMTVAEYESAINTTGMIHILRMLWYIFLGNFSNKRNDIGKILGYFMLRLNILEEKKKIVSSAPRYSNPRIDKIIDLLRGMGLGTFADNILHGDIWVGVKLDPSQLAVPASMITAINTFSECIKVGDAPNRKAQLTYWQNSSILYFNNKKNTIAKKVIDAILSPLGGSSDDIEYALHMRSEEDNINEQV
jgi:hypothetical protein